MYEHLHLNSIPLPSNRQHPHGDLLIPIQLRIRLLVRQEVASGGDVICLPHRLVTQLLLPVYVGFLIERDHIFSLFTKERGLLLLEHLGIVYI
jgi:hypothetical protein